MNVRIIGSIMILVILTGTLHAQRFVPTPKETAKPQSNADSIEVVAPPKDIEATGLRESLAANAESYRPLAWCSVDYTLSSISGSFLPPLVSSSPLGVPQASAGVLGRDSTNLLLGQSTLGSGLYNGMRITTGISLPQGVSFEVSGFFMLNGPATFHAGSNGLDNTAFARPFFEPITGQEAAELVTFPNRFVGTIDVRQRSTLWGIDANVYEKWDFAIPVTAGVGFRYANLGENLQIDQNTTALNAPALTFNGNAIPLSDSVHILDSFRTYNQFIGPQLCLRAERELNSFFFGLGAKLALGSNQQTVNITGQSDHLLGNGQVTQTANGGFLATNFNIGSHSRSVFSAIPEVNLRIGYHFNPRVNLFIGYDFLCWTSVVRPGEQIDRSVNLTQVPTAVIFNPAFGGPANPAPLFRSSELVVHTLRVGLELKY